MAAVFCVDCGLELTGHSCVRNVLKRDRETK
jgi:hypothetical protein